MNFPYIEFLWVSSGFFIIFFLEGLFPLYKGRPPRSNHSVQNIMISAVDGFIGQLFAAGFVVVSWWAVRHSLGLLNVLNAPASWEIVVAFVFLDAWMYIWHRINHVVPLFWRFHSVHHVDCLMDSTTALRFHPVEIVFSLTAILFLIALLGFKYHHILIYQLTLYVIVLFHHSNIALPEKVDRILRSVIVTPNMHRIHHSIEFKETNSNYSSVFSFWDRILGSFRQRPVVSSIIFGLHYFRDDKWQGFLGAMRIPFIKRS